MAATEHATNLLPEVEKLRDEIIENRRYFHMYPEVAFKEFKTAEKVAELLRSYGITEVFEKIGQTGVVGIIRGAFPGPCIGLRADMDALPIQETATIPHASKNAGVMHACGHDGHMAGLLAAAKILNSQKDSLAGVIKLVFQPAEEGLGGARDMIKDGVLEDTCGPKVDVIYGLHLWSMGAMGIIECQGGPVMAASDRFDIDVKGKGGHGAAPQGTVDAIVEAAALVSALQTVVSRNKDPMENGVLTVATISGGYNYNIIADHVKLTGTCRSFTPEVQELIKKRMGDICCGVAATYGGEIDLKYTYGYPPTVNAYPECVDVVNRASASVVGPERSGRPQRTMGAEDFSYFLQQRPGCFFFVGAALPGDTRPHHKSVFDFDEEAILVGASVFVNIVREVLAKRV